MSFARGFQTGWSAVGEAIEEREKRKLREGLKRAGSLEQETIDPAEMARNLEGAGINPDTGQPYYTVSGGMVQPNFEYEGMQRPAGGLRERQQYQPSSYGASIALPETTQYQLGGRTQGTQFSPEEVNRARTEEMARVYEQQGMPEEAMRMRQLAQQQELTGIQRQREKLQLSTAQRQQEFDTALQNVNKQKFEKPEDRTAAILDVYRSYDPKGAAQLEASYTQNELNKITLDAKKFEQNYKEARAKGVDSVIDWYDSVNDGFTLRRDGNIVYRTDATTGQETVFLQGTDRELMSQLDAYATPGGFLNLAKTEADIAKSQAQTALARSQAGAINPTAQRQEMTQNIALADQFRKQLSDIDKELQNYTEGTPQYAALARQRNEVAAALRDVNAVIRPPGLTRGDAEPSGVAAAREVARSGTNPVTRKPFTAAEKAEYERIFGEKFPEPSRTAPTAPVSAAPPSQGGGLTKSLELSFPAAGPSVGGRGRTPSREARIPEPPPKTTRGGRPNSAYAEWDKKFGERYRAQQR
jgi:hypothetical protein